MPEAEPAGLTPQKRRQWWTELGLIAGVSLGQSAVYAVVRLADLLSRAPLREGEAKLNVSQSSRPVFDLIYQLLGISFALVPVVFALYLMSRDQGEPRISERLQLRASAARDIGIGAGLLVVIGGGTLLIYAAGRAAGLTAEISPANLAAHWWTVPVLILAAAKNGILEEVLLFGFGADRLRKLGYSPWVIIVALAMFRGSYHLYQGIGPFIGNVLMGLIFGAMFMWWKPTRGHVMPFVWAHTLLDAVGFLAPEILALVDPLS